MTIIEMRVHIDCAGCQERVRNSLEKLKGVDDVEIDMAMQKVTVTGWADQKKVLKTARKNGRRAELWQLPYSMDSTNHQLYNQHHINGPVTQFAPQPSSSYNYYKHGYDNNGGGLYYNHQAQSSSMFGQQTGAAFSDENPHACSLM